MGSSAPPRVVLGLVQDVFFIPQIESVARQLGYEMAWLAPGEDVVARMVALQPGLFVVDIADAGTHWDEHIARAKASAATRRVPVVAFGSHVDTATMARARQAGADEVLARSRFVQILPELLEKHARVMRAEDWELLETQCAGPLPEAARRGLEEFNRGEYFECHETLEHLWIVTPPPVRDLYRAVLQVAVAYHHITRGNLPGALKVFDRSKQWFHRLPDRCQGVDLAQLRADADRVEAEVRRALSEGRGEIDGALLRPVAYDRAA
jgi:predicted metal-dependent hydrolase